MLSLISNIRTNRIKKKTITGFKSNLENYSTDNLLPQNDLEENIIYSKNWLELYRQFLKNYKKTYEQHDFKIIKDRKTFKIKFF